MAARIVEAMRGRGDLGLNEVCAIRVVDPCELLGERLQAVEGVQIAEKLRGETLAIDHRLDNARHGARLAQNVPTRDGVCSPG